MDIEQLRGFLEEKVRHGKTNAMILEYLKKDFDIEISLRTLKNYLRRLNIRRTNHGISQVVVANAITKERAGPGLNYGYRMMHRVLRNRHGLLVGRKAVTDTIKAIGPTRQFSEARAFPWQRCLRYCPGPDFRWCEDGHDKLGKYDIYIHGCIDEYSRRIMWLRAFTNNRQSQLVASYYLAAVRELGVVPHWVVSDFGRESTIIAQCQAFFYATDQNPGAHHKWTYSIRNVTVESWWRRLRQMCTLYWHREFQQHESDGLWNGDIVDRWALVLVYLPLINADLDRTAYDHNLHRIRSQRGRLRPGGQPDDLYNIAERFGGRRCGRQVTDQEIDAARAMFDLPNPGTLHAVPEEVERLFDYFVRKNGVIIDRDNARSLYIQVRAMLNDICA